MRPPPTGRYEGALAEMGAGAEALFARATQQVIADQAEAGVDVVTDGEVRRENYIHYHCRHLRGFDFANLVEKDARGGVFRARLRPGPSQPGSGAGEARRHVRGRAVARTRLSHPRLSLSLVAGVSH